MTFVFWFRVLSFAWSARFFGINFIACDRIYPQTGSDNKTAVDNNTVVFVALIPISGEPEGPLERDAFLHAVDDINGNDSVLPTLQIVPSALDSAGDTWTGFLSAADGISEGAVAVVGPGLSTVAEVVSPLATHTQIPFLSPSATSLSLAFRDVHNFLLQLAPTERLLSEATVDLLVHFGWQNIGIVQSHDHDGHFLNVNNLASRSGLKIIHIAEIPRLLPHNDTQAGVDTVTALMKQLKYFHARIIIANVPDHNLYVVFKAAARLGMIGSGYLWIVSRIQFSVGDLDPEVAELMEGSLGLSTALPERVEEWRVRHKTPSTGTETVSVYQLYTYDCVWLLARAIDSFLRDGHSLETELLSDGRWSLPSLRRLTNGHLLVNYILNTSFEGIAGTIEFDNQTGERFGSLHIINVVNGTYRLVGRWDSHGETVSQRVGIGEGYAPIRWPGGTTAVPSDRALNPDQTIDIMAMVVEPYVFYDPSKEGNDRFSGYLVRILQLLKDKVGFSYRLEKWNGTYNDLVKYIGDVNNPYTLGLSDVVPTAERLKLVDFTATYHFTSLTALLSAPAVASASGLWGFLAPFHYGVWLMLLGFFGFSAVLLKVLELGFSPRICFELADFVKGVFECLWISFSILFC